MIVLTNDDYGFLIHNFSWLAESFQENITKGDMVSLLEMFSKEKIAVKVGLLTLLKTFSCKKRSFFC